MKSVKNEKIQFIAQFINNYYRVIEKEDAMAQFLNLLTDKTDFEQLL